jgi:SAM-dependent methyltransferase
MLRKFLEKLYSNTNNYRRKVVRETLKKYGPFENFLDVGCWDGTTTLDSISLTKVKNIYGVEPVKEYAEIARKKGLKTKSFFVDNEEWEFKDDFFDCINSFEVIEHLTDLDFYFEQSYKKLKKGGYLITTTNNLSSFHNIISLVLGWAPLDLANSSKKLRSVGNPLSLHQDSTSTHGSTWTHKCVYTPYWLTDWAKLYGFEFVDYKGIGFYPLPPEVGSVFKKNSSFFTLILKKN